MLERLRGPRRALYARCETEMLNVCGRTIRSVNEPEQKGGQNYAQYVKNTDAD